MLFASESLINFTLGNYIRMCVLPNFTTCHNPAFLKTLVGFQNNLVILRFKCTLHGKIKDYFDIKREINVRHDRAYLLFYDSEGSWESEENWLHTAMTLSQPPTKQNEKLFFQSGECSVLPLSLLSFLKKSNNNFSFITWFCRLVQCACAIGLWSVYWDLQPLAPKIQSKS